MGFSIKEASQMIGITSYTLRYYEKEGLLPIIKRDEQGNRKFENSDIEWISLMTCFRNTGMSVAALKKMVDLAILGNHTIPERKEILRNHRLELDQKQLELDQAFRAVDSKFEMYEEIEKNEKI